MTNGTARRSILKAITGALAMAAAAAKPKPGAVTQAELQEVIDLYNETERRAAAIRRRLNAGATIEPGRLAAEDEAQASERWLKENGGIGEWAACDLGGIYISPAE